MAFPSSTFRIASPDGGYVRMEMHKIWKTIRVERDDLDFGRWVYFISDFYSPSVVFHPAKIWGHVFACGSC